MKKRVSQHYALKWFFVFSEKKVVALLKNGHTFHCPIFESTDIFFICRNNSYYIFGTFLLVFGTFLLVLVRIYILQSIYVYYNNLICLYDGNKYRKYIFGTFSLV